MAELVREGARGALGATALPRPVALASALLPLAASPWQGPDPHSSMHHLSGMVEQVVLEEPLALSTGLPPLQTRLGDLTGKGLTGQEGLGSFSYPRGYRGVWERR